MTEKRGACETSARGSGPSSSRGAPGPAVRRRRLGKRQAACQHGSLGHVRGPATETGNISSQPDVGDRGDPRRSRELGSQRRRTLGLPTSPSRCQLRAHAAKRPSHPPNHTHTAAPKPPNITTSRQYLVNALPRRTERGRRVHPAGRATCRVSRNPGRAQGGRFVVAPEGADRQFASPREERASDARPVTRDRWNETRLTTGVLRFWGRCVTPGKYPTRRHGSARATHSA